MVFKCCGVGVRLATAALLAVFCSNFAAAQSGAVTSRTWEGSNASPGSGSFFQCVYDRGWPCASTAAHPSIDQILQHYEEALGGTAALAKVKTRVIAQRRFQDIGTPEDEYLMRYTKQPASADARLLSIMSDTSLDGTFLRWVNGCDAAGGFSWSGRKDPSGKPHEAKNSTDGICQQELYYYGYFPLSLRRLKAAYQRFEYKGVHRIIQPPASGTGQIAAGQGPDIIPAGEARDTYLLLGVPANAHDDYTWLYFDTRTGLLLRFASGGNNPNWPNSPLEDKSNPTQLAAAGNSPRIVDLLNYRKVGDGTIAPFQFVNQGPETRVRGVIMTMVENAPVDDHVFVRPKNSLRADKGFDSTGK